ncbi:hypothetical protein HDU80_004449 [Chytriomyces hyalinus]|nr:hypothetical protein HDU80_004449 [Chytriomyces hyalinus]
MSANVFKCSHAQLLRYGTASIDGAVFKQPLSVTVNARDRWAIVGKVGSGKSTLASALTGGLRWISKDPVSTEGNKLLSFKEHSHALSYASHSIADRYHSFIGEDEVTVGQFLLGLDSKRRVDVVVHDAEGNAINRGLEVFNPFETLDSRSLSLARMFKLEELVPMPLIRLSNGQLMRTRLAKSLLFSNAANANLLILDEPFMGLDVATRQSLSSLLGELSNDPNAPNLMLLLRPQDALPSWITHVLELDNMNIAFQGTTSDFRNHKASQEHHEYAEKIKPNVISKPSADAAPKSNGSSVKLAELKNVTVQAADGAKILDNVNWTICENERWGLTGPNGSGKTTLLSILVGDHPQAYSNEVTLFGQPRGTPGVSIWDIKSRIGFVSPELHMHFTSRIHSGHIKNTTTTGSSSVTLLDVVVSGFAKEGIASHTETSQKQRKSAISLMQELGIASKMDLPFLQLSMGEQRLGFICRALVDESRTLFIFDEPFQGVDEEGVKRVHSWLAENLEGRALIIVSHHEEEIESVVTQRIMLQDGKVVVCG